MSYDLGDPVDLSWETHDSDGVLANAGDVTLTITKPDATTELPVVANPSAGVYTATYAPGDPGPYGIRWVATGANSAAFTDVFDVRQADPPLIFSLTDAHNILNRVPESDNDRIRELIESTTTLIENVVGPVVRRSVTEVVIASGQSSNLVLRHPPVISVQSITAILSGEMTYLVDDFDLDPVNGILRLRNRRPFAGTHRIVYTAGRTFIPAAIRDAARLTLRWLWSFQRQPFGAPITMPPTTSHVRMDRAATPTSGDLPPAVSKLLEDYEKTGGFA